MLRVGSLPGNKHNPQGKFRHEYVNKKISTVKTYWRYAPQEQAGRKSPLRAQTTEPLDHLPRSR